MSLGGRLRAPLVCLATLGVALAVTSPALAAPAAPPTPIDLFNGYQSCSTDVNSPTYLWGGRWSWQGVLIEGLAQDPSNSSPQLTEQFKVWPVSDPTHTTTLSNNYVSSGFEGTVTVPASDLSDGQTYAWQAQAVGAGGTSAWSAPCYFTVDDTPPSNPPTITSSNYPQGQLAQGGAPVQVTLGANGVSDVAGYVFSWTGTLPAAGVANIGSYGIPQPVDPYTDTAYFARASTLGGSATVSLIPPYGAGPMTLTVASLDRAYNKSSMATYTIFVKSTTPTIKQLVPNPQPGKQTEFHLQPNPGLQAASPVVGYTVHHYGQTEQTINVKASANGTAEVPVTLDGSMGEYMLVTSQSADGWVSDNAFWGSTIDTTPTVSSNVYLENQSSGGVGIPGTFTFAPKVKHIVSYTYSFNWGQTVTVNADDHGVAQLSWTPDQSGFYDLEVYATTRDGLELTPYDYFFSVN
jgi:hypothetical protein